MATITTPGAGVSPYRTSAAAAPTVLTTTVNGRPSLVASTTIVNGQAALNNLITTNQSGVFEGANVVINLEEQNFNTTNQVTSTTNYADGANGSIQYNNGSNGFAGDAYFTYTNGNVVTPGIRTNNYLYGNGAPFIGGGNAAIGNFVFTGDVMTISDANQVMSITGNGIGNIQVNSNGNTWTFNNVGNLTLPSNTSGINYANGSPYGVTNYSNSNVSSFLAAFGSNPVSTTGNITAGYFIGNGSQLTNITSSYGNANVVANLAALGSNPVSTTGNITGNYFIGNGSQLTGLASGYGNANVVANLAALGSNPVSTTGNITGATINANLYTAPGNITVTAGSNTWTFATTGNLVFPSGMHITKIGTDTRLSQNSGNLKLTANNTASLKVGWSQSEGTGIGPVAQVNANGPDAGYPGNVVVTTGNQSSTTYAWFFDNTGKLTAPGNITAGNLDAVNLVINSIASDDSSFITVEDGVNVNGEISATGNITGNYFIGNGSQLTSVAVPSQTILPTIQSITAVARPAGLFGGGQGGANVTVANNIPVTEYGVIITAGTTSETYKTGALGSIPGTVALTFTTGLNSTQYTLFAYVTSNAGTYYSDAVTGTSGICLLAGTQIALSDGTHKAIEDITYTDKLLSWDFDRGCYAETTAMWIKRSETGSQYNLLTFSDGTTLRTFDQHRIFNKQAGAFTYPMTAATPVGTVTVNEHGQEISLTNKQVIRDTIEYYNVITDYHMNLFSDSVLTSCRFNNIYPIVDMKFVKDNRTLRTRAEFENIEDRFFHGLRLAEQIADIETVEWYVNRLLSTEVSTQPELAF